MLSSLMVTFRDGRVEPVGSPGGRVACSGSGVSLAVLLAGYVMPVGSKGPFLVDHAVPAGPVLPHVLPPAAVPAGFLPALGGRRGRRGTAPRCGARPRGRGRGGRLGGSRRTPPRAG